MSLIKVVAAGSAAQSLQLSYVPAILVVGTLIADTFPDLSSLRVSLQDGKTIVNLDQLGIKAVSNEGFSAMPFTVNLNTTMKMNQVLFAIQLSTVEINRPCTIDLGASVGGCQVFAFSSARESKENPAVLFQTQMVNCLAGTAAIFDKFSSVHFPSMASSDDLTITYQNGYSAKMTSQELQVLNAVNNARQSIIKSGSDIVEGLDVAVMNLDQSVKSVDFTPTLAQNAYKISVILP